MHIPSMLLKQLYTFGSLRNADGGIQFSLKNRLTDVTVTGIKSLAIGKHEVDAQNIILRLKTGEEFPATDLENGSPLDFPLRKELDVFARMPHLEVGKHRLELVFTTKQYGKLKLKVDCSIAEETKKLIKIPRDPEDNYSDEIIKKRQQFVREYTKTNFDHITHYSFDPHVTAGNVENFSGVAQVPLGFAGPIQINGEHAKGEFIIPLATAEGTLVASYNRGMKILNLSGGVICTVCDDAMQRAPVFVFEDARKARKFSEWTTANFEEIKEKAEATSSVAKLTYIDQYLASKFVFLRFNYETGDAAGQNMVGRATFAACSWICDHYPDIKHFYLESNFATDKKASQINIMRTRGKRVTAEATIPRDILIQHMRVEPENLAYHGQVANVGAILSGANNNGLHSANGITAMFIATGQDVANVSESSAGIIYTELTPEKDLYISITIPSLIVATYGGGVGLPTQRECLEILGCWGRGKVKKLAEIIAGVVLAGEISLACAISSSDWVSSHEHYGRNR